MNISLTGILIEFDRGDVNELAIGAEVNLTLKSGDKTEKISDKIMRREGNQYGIFFPTTVVDNKVTPPDHLRSIVLNLEKEWLRKRAKF